MATAAIGPRITSDRVNRFLVATSLAAFAGRPYPFAACPAKCVVGSALRRTEYRTKAGGPPRSSASATAHESHPLLIRVRGVGGCCQAIADERERLLALDRVLGVPAVGRDARREVRAAGEELAAAARFAASVVAAVPTTSPEPDLVEGMRSHMVAAQPGGVIEESPCDGSHQRCLRWSS